MAVMETWHLLAALLSAVLHASWNAAVKASPDPDATMTAQMILSAVLVLPAVAWTGLPLPAAWPWLLLSTTLNVLTVAALLRAYELAGFGVGYAVVRAISVLLVIPMMAALAGERVSPMAVVGIGLIASSLVVLGFGARQGGGVPFAAVAWMAIAGIGTAGYVVADAQGVRAAGSSLAYGVVVSATNALAMCWRQRAKGSPATILWTHGLGALPIAVASAASYLLILWVWTSAPVAPTAALRDTSAVFGVIIAVVWLKEPMSLWRLAAVVLAALGVPFLRLG